MKKRLIPYAGYDGRESLDEKRRRKDLERRIRDAGRMFRRLGFDTAHIATVFNVSEAEAARMIQHERDLRLGYKIIEEIIE